MKSPSLLALGLAIGVATAVQAAEPVVWTNAVGATVSGNSLTRGGAPIAWNAGASSVNVIRDGYGYVECTVAETNTRRMCGLSFGDTDQNHTDIDFALYADLSGVLRVYENFANPWGSGSYAAGDRLRVQVAHGVVTYWRNGVLQYTSTKGAQYPLRVDTSLYDPGATLQDVVVGGSSWANAVGVSVARDTLTKTGAAGWNSGITSANQITTGDGYVEFTAGQNTTSRAAGLAHGDATQTLADIEYAIHLRDDGIVAVMESGTFAGDFGGYVGADRFRVELRGGTVRYLKNDALFYTSLVAPTYPLRADTAFDTVGGFLEDLLVEPLVWASVTGADADGATLVKTAGAGWNAGAASSNAIGSGDGWLEATAIETNTQRVFGLESGGAATTWSDIDHAIELTAAGTVKVHESGTERGSFGSYANGDLLRVEIRDGIVRYLRNGNLLYTSAVAPSYPLHADTALYTTGATLYHVTMGDIVWLDAAGVEIRGNRLRKTASAGWGNSGAFSTRAINSGFVEVVAAENNTSRMIGLSYGNVGNSYTDIDYALYPHSSGLIYIYENGTQRGTTWGSYVGGDRLKVRLQSGVVSYLKNDVVIYTSAVAPTLPLRLDAALHDIGATIGAITYPGAAAVDTLGPPVLTPGTGTYTSAQNVTITSITNASIRYTTNGSEPDGSSTLYSVPVNVNTLTTLKARAFKLGYNESPTASATYTFNYGIQPSPTLTPAQTFITSGSVTMSAGAGATIRYTTNGTDPTASSTEYTGPVTVDVTTTIRAKAFKLDWTMSPTTVVTYTVKVATPVLSLASGTHAVGAPITVTLPTPGATGNFTTNGVDPTSPATNQVAIVSGGTVFAGNYTLKVRSYKAGLTASDVATATYTVTGALGVGSISAGGAHSLAALPDGQVWGWGSGGSGEVGTGAMNEYVYQPVTAIGLTGIVQVAAGNRFTLALRKDGQVYGFGLGNHGQLGLGTASTYTYTPTLLTLAGVTALAAGERHALALKSDGTVWAWGFNGYGQLGYGATPPVLTAQENSPVPVQGLEGKTIVAIAAGTHHSVALDSEGRVWAWGNNGTYQMGDGTNTHRTRPVMVEGLWGITKIGSGTGSNHTLAVRAGDGAVFAWGQNAHGTLGDGSAVARTVPVKVVGLTDVVGIGTNYYISTAAKADGTLWSWGASAHVGDGGTGPYPPANRLVPVTLEPTGIVGVSPGSGTSYGHALALSADGVIWAWGGGPYGQIGDGYAVSGYWHRYRPVRVTEPVFQRKVATPYATLHIPTQWPTPVDVGFATLTAGATIKYTTDGNEPTSGSTTYTAPLMVAQNTTFKVKAFRGDLADSNSETLAYTIYVATPVLNPPAGTYASAQTVTITTTSPGAVIRYTTDASAPTESSTPYTAPLSIGAQTSLQVKAFHPSMIPSGTAYATYYFNVVGSAPVFAPAPGTFVGSVSVTMTAPAGATIRYTMDGSEPTVSSPAYTAPVALSSTTTLKAKAWNSGQAPSTTTTGVYTIQLDTPTLTPVGGSVPAGQAVTLGHVDPTVQLRYTTDGVDPSNAPTETVVPPGTTITINAGLTLKVRAYKTGTTPSAIATGVYTVTGSAPSPGVIATGAQSTMFAKPDGSAWMWGANSSGQLGNGSTGNRLSPTQVTELSGITSLDGGVAHGVVRKDDGTVWTAGANSYGQLGIGTIGGSRTTYAALTHAALVSPNSVASIASGWNQTLALRTDGTVWAWGANNVGQLGNGGGTAAQPSPVQVGPAGTPLTSVVQVSAARDFSLALKSDGTVWAWGSNDSGQLGNNVPNGSSNVPVQVQVSGGAALTNVAEVSAGSFHVLARKTDGTVWTWGWNGYGQLGAGGAAGTPSTRAYAAQVVQLAQVKTIAGGSLHSLAVRQDGSVWAWGHGNNGELGTGAGGYLSTPQQAIVISGIHSVAAGDYASAAVGLDGSVWAWGANYQGEVGDGTNAPTSTPKKIAEPGHAWTVGTPQFSPLAGALYAPTAVTLTSVTPGATIHYTTTGAVPTQADPYVPSGGTVVVNVSGVLKARAYKATWSPSAITSGAYTLYVPSPTASLASGTYAVDQTVTLTHSIPGTEIRYTTDGTHPTPTSTLYTTPIVVDRTVSIGTRGYRPEWTTTSGNHYSYTMKVGTPGLSVAGGAYGAAQTITVTCVTPGATLHYTLDGQEPTESSAVVAAGETILVDRSATLMVKGWRTGWSASVTAVGTYSISQGAAATPTFAPAPGTFTAVVPVTIKSATSGATIRYTTDGTTPGFRSAIYRGPVVVDATMGLRARAFREDWTPSATAVGAYTVDLTNTVAPVVFTPPGGIYTTQRTVTLTSATAGALIHYTLDGTTPTAASPSVASGGTVLVDQGVPLRALAAKTAMTSSPIRRADYQITGAISTGNWADGGNQSAMSLKTDGTVWTWGWNGYGQLGTGNTTAQQTPVMVPGLTGVVGVAMGGDHALAVKSDGTVWAWGLNQYGAIGDGTQTTRYSPVQVNGLTNAIAVAAYWWTSFALTADGTVYAWGTNSAGRLGLGTSVNDQLVPAQIPGLSSVTSIAIGMFNGLAVKTDGTVMSWGENIYGQIGDGTQTNRPTPVPVPSLGGIVVVASGTRQSMATRTDGGENGVLYAWGGNGDGSLGDGSLVDRYLPGRIVGGLREALSYRNGVALYTRKAIGGPGAIWGSGYHRSDILYPGSATTSVVPQHVVGGAYAAVEASWVRRLALHRNTRILEWNAATSTPNANGFALGITTNADADPDGDGLSTAIEWEIGTDGWNRDTNGDGISDGAAMLSGQEAVHHDVDGDGLDNAVERAIGTDPFNPDTDGDGHLDGADAFPLDPTRWEMPPPDPGDTTPPIITLTEPTNAVLISVVPPL